MPSVWKENGGSPSWSKVNFSQHDNWSAGNGFVPRTVFAVQIEYVCLRAQPLAN